MIEENDCFFKYNVSEENENSSTKYSTSPCRKRLHNSINTKATISTRDSIEMRFEENPFEKRRKESKYKLDIINVPRPTYNDETYRNQNNEYVFSTDKEYNVLAPHSNAFYVVKETDNSSIRLVRPSMPYIPTEKDVLDNAHLMLGLNIQPFAQYKSIEKSIPVVEVYDEVERCRKCLAVFNSKCQVGESSYTCSVCSSSNRPKSKDKLGYEMASSYGPTIDFKLGSENLLCKETYLYYIFIIDISSNSQYINYHQYVLSSIQANIAQIVAKDDKYSKVKKMISLITYDARSVQFYHYDAKSKEIKTTLMPSINDPFCPIPDGLAFNEIGSQKNEMIIEKILSYAGRVSHKEGGVMTSSIYAAFDQVKNIQNKGHTHISIFSASKCGKGIVSYDEFEQNRLYSSENEIKLFLPHHNSINYLSSAFKEKSISLNIFSFGHNNEQIHLPTFYELCFNTGGEALYYSINKDEWESDIKLRLEKLHYDMNRILLQKRYTDVKIILRLPYELGIKHTFPSFTNNDLRFSSVSENFNLTFDLYQKSNLNNKQVLNIQCEVQYLNTEDNLNYIRIINYSFVALENIFDVFSKIDVDSMTRLFLAKELTETLTEKNKALCSYEKMRLNLIQRIVDILFYYKIDLSSNLLYDNLTLPNSIRYLPLYISSFLKKPPIRKIKHRMHPNVISYYNYILLTSPLDLLIKGLYPRLYRVDEIKSEITVMVDNQQTIVKDVGIQLKDKPFITKPPAQPLIWELVDMDTAYLHDDGKIITLVISRHVDSEFIKELFEYSDFDELVDNLHNINPYQTFSETDFDLYTYKSRIVNLINEIRNNNQSFKVILLDYDNCQNESITTLFTEDQFKEESSYADFLVEIHDSIVKRINNIING